MPWESCKDVPGGSKPLPVGQSSKDRSTRAQEESAAVKRVLDLCKMYKQGDTVGTGNGEGKVEIKDTLSTQDADQVLQAMIDALLQSTQQDERRRIAEWTSKVDAAGKDGAPSATAPVSPAAPATPPGLSNPIHDAYPDAIPVEAVTVSSLATIARMNKKQTGNDTGINSALRLAASDARKNIGFLKEDLAGLREGANSKAKTLKSLLKKNLGEGKQRSRKSVRLQDAAGRGEGPRDEARGETEEEARYRRLREMASRLNE